MKFLRIGSIGSEIPVVSQGDVYLDLRSITPDITPEFLAEQGIERTRASVASGTLREIEFPKGVRIGAPISRAGAIITVATNYYGHAEEAGRPIPEEPVIVLKAPSSLSGPGDPILLPPGSTRLDWEAELGIVVGTSCFQLRDDDDPLRYVAGFVTANDVAERDYQFVNSGNQWGKGKSYPSFTPVGPLLVTPDEVDHRNISIATFVNGERRQESSTSDMIFDAGYLVRYLSQYVRLEAGDLILTGTPQGVALSGHYPYLSVGDVVDVELAGLGAHRATVVPA